MYNITNTMYIYLVFVNAITILYFVILSDRHLNNNTCINITHCEIITLAFANSTSRTANACVFLISLNVPDRPL